MANQIKILVDSNIEVGVVIGGGNIFRGRYCDELSIEREDGDYMGMVATIFNSLSFEACLKSIDVDCEVMSALDIEKVCEPYKNKKALKYLSAGKVVIFAAGTGKPYYSTDTCAALRAKEIKADIILMAKNGVDGVYSSDPRIDKDAVRFSEMTYDEILSNNLKVMDLTAATLCNQNKISMVIFDMNVKGNIKRAFENPEIGTIIKSK